MVTQEAINRELARRRKVAKGPVEGGMFPAQRAAFTDAASYVACQCTVRAGKTFGYFFACLADEEKHHGASYIYIAKTLDQSKRVWRPVINELMPEWAPTAKYLKADSFIELPNGGSLILFGADKEGIGDALHGLKLRKVMLDECAFYGIDLRHLVYEVLEPRLADSDGQMILASAPGFFPRGLFWEIVAGERPGWSVHKWSYRDNPHVVEKMTQFIERKIEQDPTVVDTPAFRRNYLNEWVTDQSNRVYKLDPEKNLIKDIDLGDQSKNHYILGLDLGYDDATAFAVLMYRDASPQLTVLVAEKASELSISEIASRLRMYRETFPRLTIVGDASKKQVFQELRLRHSTPILPAEKLDKQGWIQMVNSDLELGIIKAVESQCLQWIEEVSDLTWRETRYSKRMESPGQANDCCDAVLYAYRQARHYRAKPAEARPVVGTSEYHKALSERLEREADEYLLSRQRESENWYE